MGGGTFRRCSPDAPSEGIACTEPSRPPDHRAALGHSHPLTRFRRLFNCVKGLVKSGCVFEIGGCMRAMTQILRHQSVDARNITRRDSILDSKVVRRRNLERGVTLLALSPPPSTRKRVMLIAGIFSYAAVMRRSPSVPLISHNSRIPRGMPPRSCSDSGAPLCSTPLTNN